MKSRNRNSAEETGEDEKFSPNEKNDVKIPSEDSETFSSLLGEFASSTSAHGIGKIYAAQSNRRRVLWVLSVLLVYSVMFWMCSQLFVQFMNKPVQSRIEVSQEENLEFPAVTICNLNMLKSSQQKKYMRLYSELEAFANDSDEAKQKEYRETPIKKGNTSTENNKHEKKQRFLKKQIMRRAKSKTHEILFAEAEIDTSNMLTKMADKVLRNTPVEYLTSMGHQFHETVVDCRFSHFKCNTGSLQSLWKSFWHWKYGNCFTFNSGTSKEGKKLPVLTVDRAGPYDGLDLLIDIKQHLYLPTSKEAGIRVVLTDQGKMPFPFDEGFSLPTGFSTSVGVRRVHTRRVDPFHNNSCIAGDNSKDSEDLYRKIFNSEYSVLTCRNSCLASKQRKTCNCSETRFPLNNTSPCETEQQEECLDQVMKDYQKSGMDCETKCPQPCLDNLYRYTVSSSKWSHKHLSTLKKQFRWRFKKNKDDLGDNFLKLSIFYKEMSQEKIIYKEAYLLENLLADFGGQLGLWIGVSVLTAGEVIELVVNLAKFIGRKWMKKRRGTETFENSLEMKA